MIKYFCDVCGEEIYDANKTYDKEGEPGRLGIVHKSMMIEIITGSYGVWNEGDFCKYCIFDTIKEMDDRPKKEK